MLTLIFFSPHLKDINSPPFHLIDQHQQGSSLLQPPVNHRHPRSSLLRITHEKVVSLSGCITRASIVTASGAIASWMDDVLPVLLHAAAPTSAAAIAAISTLARLDHPACHYHELKGDTVSSISTAPLITVVQCASGAVYWWGVLPSYIRQRNAERQKQPASSFTPGTSTPPTSSTRQRNSSSGGGDGSAKNLNANAPQHPLSPGDLVCMKNAPMFHAGAIGFTLVNGVPKAGVLLEDAWKLTDVCRFRVKSSNTPLSSLLGSIATKNLFTTSSSTAAAVGGTGAATTLLPQPQQPSEAVHALSCPYAQAAAAVAAQAAAADLEQPPPADSGSLEMPPPPSPASSTCSDQSGPVKVSPGTFSKFRLRLK